MRGKQVSKRPKQKDREFNSILVGQFINLIMKDGKKHKAEKLIYSCLEQLKQDTGKPELESLEQAVANVTPKLEVKTRRVGGANYSVPIPVQPERGHTLALRWIIEAARTGSGNSFDVLLARELATAYKGEGNAVKKRQNVEKMAEANKAFAQFRW